MHKMETHMNNREDEKTELEEEVSSLRGGNWLNILVLLHCTVTPIFDRKCLQAQFRCMFFLSITIGLSKMRQLIDKT